MLIFLQQLNFTDMKVKIKTFHIIKYKIFQESEIYRALITYLHKNIIYVSLFDIENGTCTKSISIM